MRSLIYIIAALNFSFAAMAENPYGGPKGRGADHYLDNGGGRGGQPNGEEAASEEEAKPKRIFDSFGDSLRASEEKHQAQVDAIVAGRARAPRGAAQNGVFSSFPSAGEARPAARQGLRRPDPATEQPRKPSGNPYR